MHSCKRESRDAAFPNVDDPIVKDRGQHFLLTALDQSGFSWEQERQSSVREYLFNRNKKETKLLSMYENKCIMLVCVK